MTTRFTRRACLALFALGATEATAQAGLFHEEANPTDVVPHYYPLAKFLELDESDIYMANLALKRGRQIRIEGYAPSESKAIIRRAAKDWPATRRSLGGR